MKSHLEAIVPPRKLCQMIPEGCFADSAFVRPLDVPGDPVWTRGTKLYDHMRLVCGIKMVHAPTLEEIMLALSDGELNSTIACREKSIWQVNVEPASEENGKEERPCSFEASNKKSGATAALILWLKRYFENYGGEE